VAPAGTEVIFANAVFQWVPNHLKHMQRLLGALAPGGVLAVQMPDNLDEPSHILMREVAFHEPWREQLSKAAELRDTLPKPGVYYDALKPLCSRLEIWHTVYNHALDSAVAIVEWVRGTGLRPFVDPLELPERKAYLAAYTARVAAAYPPQADGKVLLRFPRLFIVATK
jgi:trans-aconitate 2-methyltransferase